MAIILFLFMILISFMDVFLVVCVLYHKEMEMCGISQKNHDFGKTLAHYLVKN